MKKTLIEKLNKNKDLNFEEKVGLNTEQIEEIKNSIDERDKVDDKLKNLFTILDSLGYYKNYLTKDFANERELFKLLDYYNSRLADELLTVNPQSAQTVENEQLMKTRKHFLNDLKNTLVDRKSEQAVYYGPFEDSMKKCSRIASAIADKEITVSDCFIVMIAMKLSRQTNKHKFDNGFDAAAYLIEWFTWLENENS